MKVIHLIFTGKNYVEFVQPIFYKYSPSFKRLKGIGFLKMFGIRQL